MSQIHAEIKDWIVEEFRDVVYSRKGLKRGDFKESLEEAMVEYILKYTKSKSSRNLAKQLKKKIRR